jgi:RimJ/RimL family protein N-acetyltransferase
LGGLTVEFKRPFLVGKIIYLQPMDSSCYEGKYLNWVNDNEIIDNMGTLFFPTTEESLLAYIKEKSDRSDCAFFAIRLKETDDFVGTVKLDSINWVHRTAYFGRMIGSKDCRGKGIGTESTELILSYGFDRLNLHWIGAGMVAENKASIKSNEKAGMRELARIPNQLWFKGRYVDSITMGVTAEEYYGITDT